MSCGHARLCRITKRCFRTDAPDGRYYEVTYNGDKQEFYFDAYIKEHNQLIK